MVIGPAVVEPVAALLLGLGSPQDRFRELMPTTGEAPEHPHCAAWRALLATAGRRANVAPPPFLLGEPQHLSPEPATPPATIGDDRRPPRRIRHSDPPRQDQTGAPRPRYSPPHPHPNRPDPLLGRGFIDVPARSRRRQLEGGRHVLRCAAAARCKAPEVVDPSEEPPTRLRHRETHVRMTRGGRVSRAPRSAAMSRIAGAGHRGHSMPFRGRASGLVEAWVSVVRLLKSRALRGLRRGEWRALRPDAHHLPHRSVRFARRQHSVRITSSARDKPPRQTRGTAGSRAGVGACVRSKAIITPTLASLELVWAVFGRRAQRTAGHE